MRLYVKNRVYVSSTNRIVLYNRVGEGAVLPFAYRNCERAWVVVVDLGKDLKKSCPSWEGPHFPSRLPRVCSLNPPKGDKSGKKGPHTLASQGFKKETEMTKNFDQLALSVQTLLNGDKQWIVGGTGENNGHPDLPDEPPPRDLMVLTCTTCTGVCTCG